MIDEVVPKVLFFEAGIAGGSVHHLLNLLSSEEFQTLPHGVFTVYNRGNSAQLLQLEGPLRKGTLALDEPAPPDPLHRRGGVPLPTGYGVSYFRSALSFIARAPGAVVYLNNTPYIHLPAIAAARLLKRRIICHLRDTIAFTRMERAVLPFIDTFVALSHAAEAYYRRQGVPRDRIHVVYNGIKLARFTLHREPSGLEPVKAVVTGSINARKGQDICVRGLELAVKSNPHLELLIVGGGDEDGTLRRQIRKAGVQDKVRLLGHSQDVPSLLAQCHIGILTSRREGMPNSVMEYMAAGLPVIVSDLPGIDELVTHGHNGFIIPQESPEALAEKLVLLAGSAETRRMMGSRARDAMEREHFLPSREVQDLLKLIGAPLQQMERDGRR